MYLVRFTILILSLIAAAGAAAQEPLVPAPLTFQAWKDQQVLEAQNQVLRISARISSLRTTKPKGSKTEPANLANGKLKKVSDTDTLAAAEQDLRRAQESLSSANNLQFEDYVDVYIPTLSDQPEALQKLSDKLTKEELAEIFKALMKAKAVGDAKRSAALLDTLTPSPRK